MRSLVFALACAAAGSSFAAGINEAGLVNTCNSCHGVGGVSVGPSIPNLAGLDEGYLKRVMMEQKKGDRFSTIMGRLLKTYSDDEIAVLAKYFAAKEWKFISTEKQAELADRGRGVYRKYCQNCHEKDGQEKNNEDMARLSGQWPGYLKLETLKYVDKSFTDRKPSEKMAEKISHLSDDEVAAAAHFLASRKGGQ